MALLSGIAGFFDKYVLGYAIGTAAGPALEPYTQDLANLGWQANQVRPLDAVDLAEIVAEDVELESWGEDEASLTGVNKDRFDALVGAARAGPGIAQLFELRRRKLIDDARFEHGLRKMRLETLWDDGMHTLLDRLLTPAELANARQQGFIDEGRQHAEAELQGVDPERADIQFELSGLPPGVETGLEMLRRGIITEAQFAELVRTGHTKTKWTAPLLELRNQVLHAVDYAGLWLRGWITQTEAEAGGALTGYSPELMRLLYLNRGRPATTRQAFLGYIRGGRVAGQAWGERETFRRAVEQSDIRSEWEPVLWAQRHVYPAAFVLRSLTQAGDISRDDAYQVLIYEGWEPTFAAKVADAWGGAQGPAVDAHVKSARTSLFSATHRSYVAEESDDAAATQALTVAGVDPAVVPTVLEVWGAERELVRRQLTRTDIRKLYRDTRYTHDEAVARIVALGYSPQDAEDYLVE